MRSKFLLIAARLCPGRLPATAARRCPDRGSGGVNVPVVTTRGLCVRRGGSGRVAGARREARLDGWFQGLGLGYGDSIYVDGGLCGQRARPGRADRRQIRHAGCRRRAGDRGRRSTRHGPRRRQPPPCRGSRLPELEPAVASPTSTTSTMPNFGCGVNSNLAAMVANPEDLIHGREGDGVGDPRTGARRSSSTAQARRRARRASRKSAPKGGK